MVILEVVFATIQAHRADFLACLNDAVAASLAETGCITYRPTVALDDPLTIHLLEIWADEAAYLAHRTTPEQLRFRAAFPAYAKVVSMIRRAGDLRDYTPPA